MAIPFGLLFTCLSKWNRRHATDLMWELENFALFTTACFHKEDRNSYRNLCHRSMTWRAWSRPWHIVVGAHCTLRRNLPCACKEPVPVAHTIQQMGEWLWHENREGAGRNWLQLTLTLFALRMRHLVYKYSSFWSGFIWCLGRSVNKSCLRVDGNCIEMSKTVMRTKWRNGSRHSKKHFILKESRNLSTVGADAIKRDEYVERITHLANMWLFCQHV